MVLKRKSYYVGSTRTNKRNEVVEYWRCREKTCKGTLNTIDSMIIKDNSENHTCDIEVTNDDIFKKNMMRTLKDRCRTEMTPVPKIYREEARIFFLENPDEMG